MAKFGAMSTDTPGLAASHDRTWLQPFVGEAGGPHDGVNAVVDEKLEVRHDDVGVREVDDNFGVAVGQQVQRITGVDFCGQAQILGGRHRLHHRRADFALRSQHPYPHGVTLDGVVEVAVVAARS